MRKILVPTDFSDNSWNAIKYALQLFKDQECNFVLLNTYTPIIYRLGSMQTSSAQFGLVNAMKETSKKGLDTIQQKIEAEFNNPKHTYSQISSFNTLTAEINELYKGNVMDTIVMGTKGATGAKEVLFGTNTVHVIKKAKCPVLAVPDNFDFETPKEILFPTDYEIDYQYKHVKAIIDIADVFNSRVNVLNVSYGYDLSEGHRVNKQKLSDHFKETSHLFHSVVNQHIPDAINDFQVENHFNLMVMINNKHSFFENLFFRPVINQIGFHLNVPFLVIPSSRT